MRAARAFSIMVGVVLVWVVAVAQIPTSPSVTDAGPQPTVLGAAAANTSPIVSLAVAEVPPCKYPCADPKPTVPSPPATLPSDVECGTLYLTATETSDPDRYVYSFDKRVDAPKCDDILDPVDCSSSGGWIVLNVSHFSTDRLPFTAAISPAEALPAYAKLNVYCPSGAHHLRWTVVISRTISYTIDCGDLYLTASPSGEAGQYTYDFADRTDAPDCSEFLDPVECSSSQGTIILNGSEFSTDSLPVTAAISPADAFPGASYLNVYCPAGVRRAVWTVQDASSRTPK